MAPIFRTAGSPGTSGARGRSWPRRAFALLLATIAVACQPSGPARAQNAYCDSLRAQIATAGGNPESARFRAAAQKQQGEIDRTVAYRRSLGCDRQQFLFFGSPPPPQCGQVDARIRQMQGNLASLQQATGDGQRQALIARYETQCRQRVVARPRNFLEDLFGGAQEEDPTPQYDIPSQQADEEGARGLGGSMAICVRSCDGGFFPVSYSARRANLEALAELCRAQCPNAEVKLYTRSPSRDVESALSIDGEPYSDHPNALKFTKKFDPTCSCKAPDKSWSETLADAERLLAEKHGDDVVVSAEKAEELSRPVAPRARKGVAAPLEAAPESSQGDKSAPSGKETVREVVGPDGVKRRMRVVAPSL